MSQYTELQVSRSPLQLDGYFIKRLSFSTCEFEDDDSISIRSGYQPTFESELPASAPHLTINFGIDKDTVEARYRFQLDLTSKKQEGVRQAYDFRITVVAFYSWSKLKNEPEDIERIIQSAAINTMYPICREALASATGRGPFPAIILPSLSFKFSAKDEGDKKPKTALKAKTPSRRTQGKTSRKKDK